jgi:hypothetical protein
MSEIEVLVVETPLVEVGCKLGEGWSYESVAPTPIA